MKFPAARWADAYLSAAGSDGEIGLRVLKCFEEAVKTGFKKHISGKMRAREAVDLLNRALSRCDAGEKTQGILAAEASLSLLILRGYFPFLSAFIRAIEHARHQRQGILEAVLETAAEASADFLEELRRRLIETSGAHEVSLSVRIKPELIGGFRLTIGGERQDFSVNGHLKQLQKTLERMK